MKRHILQKHWNCFAASFLKHEQSRLRAAFSIFAATTTRNLVVDIIQYGEDSRKRKYHLDFKGKWQYLGVLHSSDVREKLEYSAVVHLLFVELNLLT